MWNKIKDSDYFLSLNQKNHFEICVTDYVAIWTITYSEKAFIAQVKNSNKRLILKEDSEYVTKGLYLLSNTDQLKKTNITKEENGELSISLKILHGLLFSFESKLIKGSDEFFFNKITQPLLKTIYELHTSQVELRKELKRKDIEINEYKTEGEAKKVILRVTRITKPFKDEEYMAKYKSYGEYFGSTDIPPSLLERSFEIPQNEIKEEPATETNVKEEPNNIKQVEIMVKQEQHTPLPEDTPASVIPAVACKQEAIKTEQQSSQSHNNMRRKRKLNI